MCTTCGCSDGAKATVINLETGKTSVVGDDQRRDHDHAHGHGHAHDHDHHHHGDHDHDHSHDHGHHHHHDHDHGHGQDHAHSNDHIHVGGQTISLEQAVLQKNDELAARNRAWFSGREILALNLVSSPGAGKTTLLERTIADCRGAMKFFVVEGDQATAKDGERIKAAGAPVVQVNTGTGCHLEADMVARAVHELKPDFGSVVMIENVGNLVCPALFDLGEHAKVAILSVTEGDDKPLKYPHMFQAAEVMIVNKIDLLEHVDFDIDLCIEHARQVNPDITVFKLSARTGEGLQSWYDWIATAGKTAGERAFA